MQSSQTAQEQSKQSLDFDKLYYRDLQRQFVVDLLKNEGDFLLRRGATGGKVLSVHCKGEILHFKFKDNQKEYKFEGHSYKSLGDLIIAYHSSGETVTQATGAKLVTPIQSDFRLIDAKRIKLEKQLGKGNFGLVWRARLFEPGKPEGEMVAVKVLTGGGRGGATEKDRAECLAEAKIMTMLTHENVVGIKGVSFGTTNTGEPELQLVLEYCNAGSLDKLLEDERLSDAGKASALLDAAKGMAYLHDRGIIHRDIASRNCLAHMVGSRTIVKIADFGLSRLAPDHYELAIKRKLPVFSMPPESLHTREWNKASDVWSFGILMLEMYNKGHNPYEAHFNKEKADVKAVIRYFNDGKRLDPPRGMPREIAELCVACLSKRVNDRPSMKDLAERLKKFCLSKKK